MNWGSCRDQGFRASRCLHCGVLRNQAVHPLPQAGLDDLLPSLTLNTGLQALNMPEVCSPTNEQIFGNVLFVIMTILASNQSRGLQAPPVSPSVFIFPLFVYW